MVLAAFLVTSKPLCGFFHKMVLRESELWFI